MNYLDIIFIVLLIVGALQGFYRGLIIEITSLAALVLGVVFGVIFADVFTVIIRSFWDVSEFVTKVIGFIIIFLAVLFGIRFLGKLIEKGFKFLALNIYNRIAGLLIGIFKAAFIISVVLIPVNVINKDADFLSKERQNNSFFYKPISNLAPSILPERDFIIRITQAEDDSEDNNNL